MEEQWKYWISANALSLMAEEGQAKYPKETGGILIGWRKGCIFYIEVAIGPGPKAIHKRNSFTRDGDFSQARLDQIVVATANKWDYIGEWHSHPRRMGPSTKDINSLRTIKKDAFYNISNPLMGVLIYEQSVWGFHCFIFQNDQRLVHLEQIT